MKYVRVLLIGGLFCLVFLQAFGAIHVFDGIVKAITIDPVTIVEIGIILAIVGVVAGIIWPAVTRGRKG